MRPGGPAGGPRGQGPRPHGAGPPSCQGGPPQAQRRSRLFVALFDYDPVTMSPNPESADEELPFSEGDLIKVNTKYWCFDSYRIETHITKNTDFGGAAFIVFRL